MYPLRHVGKRIAARNSVCCRTAAVQTGKKTNGMAIAGFVCSFFFALLGLIFSIIGMQQCKERGDNGYGLAKAGMIISIVWMAIVIIVAVAR